MDHDPGETPGFDAHRELLLGPMPVLHDDGTTSRYGRDGRLLARPTETELEMGRLLHELADRFAESAVQAAGGSEEQWLWRRGEGRARRLARDIDGGDVVRIELSIDQGRAVLRFMHSLPGQGIDVVNWRLGRTWVDLSEPQRYCDLVSEFQFRALDVVEAIDIAGASSPDVEALNQVRDLVLAAWRAGDAAARRLPPSAAG